MSRYFGTNIFKIFYSTFIKSLEAIKIDVDLNDKNHTHQIIGNEFDMKLYQSIEKMFKEKVDEVFNYSFNKNIGYKLLSVDENEIPLIKSSIIEIAIVDIINGDKVLNLVPKFNEGKYQKI